MRTYRFTLTEHGPDRPWMVRAQDVQTVTLDGDTSFFDWVHEHWPAPQWSSSSTRGNLRRNPDLASYIVVHACQA